ncbi:ABC transporter ATP-binding protein [Caproiciproducens sp. CPB-2]|jgi:spermidine/putrescine ABC transporter ATP-binding subunit|uniref:ABC transporter ATP-binding protein n=1 Tax=unclassified Caproiciproducens TaxID=2643836 RepID=UPI0023D9DF92|nr:ABC transporter ATP-binding protein [Caproiciproducens sp. CPB-2]MDF1495254.1 ABC transporter ATP-binding protein [Caproiciproducens sp. CPB-2]
MGANIKMENIDKRYKLANVIRDVNIEIQDGEFLTILGPSGAGKTTLLKMIAGFEDPSKGKILINGNDISRTPIHKRNIGMLFQNYALFPHMTVYKNVEYPLSVRKMAKKERREKIDAVLKRVRLSEYASRYPRELSGGQQQRVALARALVFDPLILLLDEPMAALDKQLRKQMQLEIKEIHRELGITTVSVTHDQEEALTMASKVCIMKDGMIEQVATPVEIYEKPASVFCAKFIGEANVIPCPVVSVDAAGKGKIGVHGLVIPAPDQTRSYAEDDTVNIVIRPEKINLVDDSYGGLKFRGIVEQCVYIGDCLKLKVRLTNGHHLKVKVFTSYALSLDVGDEVLLGISEEDIVQVKP